MIRVGNETAVLSGDARRLACDPVLALSVILSSALCCAGEGTTTGTSCGTPDSSAVSNADLDAQIVVLGSALNEYLDRGNLEDALVVTRECQRVLARRFGEEDRSVIELRALEATIHCWKQLTPEQGEKVQSARELFKRGEKCVGERNFSGAREYFEASSKLFEQTLGIDSIMTASALQMLADVEFQLGRPQEMSEILSRVLTAQQRLLGEKHPKCARTLNDLGVINMRFGHYAKAEPQLRKALEIREQVFGKDSIVYAATLSNLADLAIRQGDAENGRRLSEEAFAIAKPRRIEDPYVYASTVWALGRCSRLEGNLAQAELHFRTALDYYGNLRHPPVEIVDLLDEYVAVLRKLGRSKDAAHFEERAAKLRRRKLESTVQ